LPYSLKAPEEAILKWSDTRLRRIWRSKDTTAFTGIVREPGFDRLAAQIESGQSVPLYIQQQHPTTRSISASDLNREASSPPPVSTDTDIVIQCNPIQPLLAASCNFQYQLQRDLRWIIFGLIIVVMPVKKQVSTTHHGCQPMQTFHLTFINFSHDAENDLQFVLDFDTMTKNLQVIPVKIPGYKENENSTSRFTKVTSTTFSCAVGRSGLLRGTV
jgi:hypothetical protein